MISGFTQTSFLNFYHVLSWLWSFSIITYNNKFVTGVMIKAQTFNDSDDGDILKLYEQDFFTAEVYA